MHLVIFESNIVTSLYEYNGQLVVVMNLLHFGQRQKQEQPIQNLRILWQMFYGTRKRHLSFSSLGSRFSDRPSRVPSGERMENRWVLIRSILASVFLFVLYWSLLCRAQLSVVCWRESFHINFDVDTQKVHQATCSTHCNFGLLIVQNVDTIYIT